MEQERSDQRDVGEDSPGQQRQDRLAEQRLRRIVAEEKTRRRQSRAPTTQQRIVVAPETRWSGEQEAAERLISRPGAPLQHGTQQVGSAEPERHRKRGFLEGVLFAVEVIALLALVAVLYLSFTTWRALNHETQTGTSVTVSPTATRTTPPEPTAMVIPQDSDPQLTPTERHHEGGGSPTLALTATESHHEDGGSPTLALTATESHHEDRLNPTPSPTPTPRLQTSTGTPTGQAEVQSVADALPTPTPATASTGLPVPTSAPPATLTAEPSATPPPPPAPQIAVRIVIPRIGVDAPIVQGDSWEDLKNGVGQHPGTAKPGETGNTVVSAHNDTYGKIFRYLHELEPGDRVSIHTADRSYDYVVVSTRIVSPTEVSITEPTEEPTLTMVTCYPYLIDTHRVVVTALLSE